MSSPASTHAPLIDWARSTLGQPDTEAVVIVDTPWSSVFRVGDAWLKRTIPELFIEAEVMSLCRTAGAENVPDVIAINDGFHAFLMSSIGDVALRTHFNGKIDAKLIARGVESCRTLQKIVAPHTGVFLEAGVPDWRLARLPALFDEVLRDEALVKNEVFSADEIKTLREQSSRIDNACRSLAAFGLPEGLNHSDLHDNNMILNRATGRIGIVDLGESAIDHPFLTLSACLKRLTGRYGLDKLPDTRQKFFNACFGGWLDSEKDLQTALGHAHILLPLYAFLAHKRLFDATGPVIFETVPRMRGRLRETLIELLDSR